MHIEIKVREVREKQGMSLAELSRRTKITKSHLSYIEREEKEPTISMLVRISLILKVDIKDLYKINF